MVQSRARLWLRQAARRLGRRGRVRAHGDGAQRPSRRPATRANARGADRAERQGTDRGRASPLQRIPRLAFVAAAVLVACSPQAPAQSLSAVQAPQRGLKVVQLTIHSRSGVHRFTVDVAKTPEQQERGLMFVRSLAPNRGMIFPYDPPQQVAFWMKNTLIPLDIVFIRADGRIARIANARALDETPLPSGEPAAVVLEIRGGRAAQLGIRAGDKVEWPH